MSNDELSNCIRMEITPEALEQLFRQGKTYEVIKGVPNDFVLSGVVIDPFTRNIHVHWCRDNVVSEDMMPEPFKPTFLSFNKERLNELIAELNTFRREKQ